jgi:putative endonuclease
MAWLYILECSDGSFYTGSTVDLERRLVEHFTGNGPNYTRKHPPVKIRFAEHIESIEQAFLREKQVQGWSRAKKLALIDGRLGDLPGLSATGVPGPSTGSGTGSLTEPRTGPSTGSGTGSSTEPRTGPSTGSGSGSVTEPSTGPSTGSGTGDREG